MGLRGLALLALGLAFAGTARRAYADGACVEIDVSRDTLTDQERYAVLVAARTALETEKIVVDHTGTRCTGMVTLYSVRLGKRITTVISSGPNQVKGDASSINELDLLIRQLMRSLVTGRAFATGTGVQDRENVLRDQTAPRRINPGDRDWIPVVAIGGGMLQRPNLEGGPAHRQYNIVSIDARAWGFITNSHVGLEVRARIMLQDYGVMGEANDAYWDSRDGDKKIDGDEFGRSIGVAFSPLAVPTWDFGVGLVRRLGQGVTGPHARLGGQVSILPRFTDPRHYFDVGFGAYVGFGIQLHENFSIGGELNLQRPTFHSDYGYWLTTTVSLEFHGDPELGGPFLGTGTPTIRRINE